MAVLPATLAGECLYVDRVHGKDRLEPATRSSRRVGRRSRPSDSGERPFGRAWQIWAGCFDPPQGAFWIQCPASDLERAIAPRLSEEGRRELSKGKTMYESSSWADTSPGLLVERDSYYFLVSRDGRQVIPTEPFHPYSGQRNSWCPFRLITPIVFGSLDGVASFRETLDDGGGGK